MPVPGLSLSSFGVRFRSSFTSRWRCLVVPVEGSPRTGGERWVWTVFWPRAGTPGASCCRGWNSGDAAPCDGFAQSFEESFELGHALSKVGLAPFESVDAPSEGFRDTVDALAEGFFDSVDAQVQALLEAGNDAEPEYGEGDPDADDGGDGADRELEQRQFGHGAAMGITEVKKTMHSWRGRAKGHWVEARPPWGNPMGRGPSSSMVVGWCYQRMRVFAARPGGASRERLARAGLAVLARLAREREGGRRKRLGRRGDWLWRGRVGERRARFGPPDGVSTPRGPSSFSMVAALLAFAVFGLSDAALAQDEQRLGACPRVSFRAMFAAAADYDEVGDLAAIEREALTLCLRRQELINQIVAGELALAELVSGPEEVVAEALVQAVEAIADLPAKAAGAVDATVAETPAFVEPEPVVVVRPEPDPVFRWTMVYGSAGDWIAGITDGAKVWWVREGDALPSGVEVVAVRLRPPGVEVRSEGREWLLPGPGSSVDTVE